MIDQQVGLHLGEGLHQGRRGRGLAQPVDGRAVAQRIDELDHEAVHVGHREHRHHLVAGRDVALAVVHDGGEVAVGEHHALRVAGGAGGVVDRGEVVPVVGREDDVVGAVAIGPLGGEQAVHLGEGGFDFRGGGPQELPAVDVHDELERAHLGDVHLGELVFVGEEGDALGVVDEEGGVLCGEVREERDDDGLVGIDGEVAHAPAGAVAGPEGDLVPLLQAELLEHEVEFLNLGGHLAIGKGFAADAVEGCFVPILSRRILQALQVMRIFFHGLVLFVSVV